MGCGQSQNKPRVENDERITKSKRVDKKQNQRKYPLIIFPFLLFP